MTLRVWSRGEWREVQLRGYEISDEFEPEYEAETADLLNQGLEAFQQDDLDEAERLFQQALEREPRATAAYDNLGSLYANRGEHERAREMFQAALEIDPLDVFARCSLALYLLDEGDVKGAEAMIAPLADVQRLHPQDMAYLTYTRAHILLERGDIDEARRALELALEIYPEYDLAQDLLDRLDTFGTLRWGFESFFEKLHKNRRARRLRQQGVLITPDPTLSEALGVYTKCGLTGMARVILPWGGWSALRKAELFQRVSEALADPRVLERIVADLSDEERAALRRVLARGGQMPWQEFDADYGNDLEESPNWEYHEPETLMGRLRLRGLLAETTVKDELLVTIPSDLRAPLAQILD
jgi:tetratricopeptide (TPR) repeat protein